MKLKVVPIMNRVLGTVLIFLGKEMGRLNSRNVASDGYLTMQANLLCTNKKLMERLQNIQFKCQPELLPITVKRVDGRQTRNDHLLWLIVLTDHKIKVKCWEKHLNFLGELKTNLMNMYDITRPLKIVTIFFIFHYFYKFQQKLLGWILIISVFALPTLFFSN